jgi:DNA topoisomerase-2
MNTIKVSDFYKNELVDYASYSTFRMIASGIDGLKNSGRKIISTILDNNIKNDIKVSQLASKIAEQKEYLHGEVSLEGAIVTLAQNFVSTNNVPLLQAEGNFGTRFEPTASASRYIYTYGSKDLFEIFSKDDDAVLIHQNFEGHDIEPRFYVPNLPMILVNGSTGIASGFAQIILPRNPEQIKKYLRYTLSKNDRKGFNGVPYFKGFKGNVKKGEGNQWIIEGVAEKISSTEVKITEVPVGYTLKSYIKVLDKLEDEGKIISYRDLCEDDDFNFIVKMTRASLSKVKDLLEFFKLQKRITENYTVLDENNRVRVFKNTADIMRYYIDVKKRYLQRRKDHLISVYRDDIYTLVSKYVFIQKIVNDELIISKRSIQDIEKDLDGIDKIIKKNDSYDYLLGMNIRSLTKEKMEELMKEIKNTKNKLDNIKSKSIEEMWLDEL